MRITFDDVAFSYGSRQVLDGLSAVVEPALVTAIVGPSGSGKSTALAAIGGFHRPRAGTIVLQDAAGQVHAPAPGLVSWVPQSAAVMTRRTVVDNVLVAPLAAGRDLAAAHEVALRALGQVGLADRASSPAGDLSGGEKQRLAFARALASTRPVVLADEPTSSLDAESTRGIARLLADLARGSTIVVATHDPLVIDAADRVVMLRGSARA